MRAGIIGLNHEPSGSFSPHKCSHPLNTEIGQVFKVLSLSRASAACGIKPPQRCATSSVRSRADAQTFARYIRAHWGIENQLHWCLDVVFREDASRIRSYHAPRNIGLLPRLALNLLRLEPSKASLAMKRYRAGWDDQFMLQILSANFPNIEAQSDS